MNIIETLAAAFALFFGVAVIIYAVVLLLRHIFSMASKTVAANLANSRAQILVERQQMEEEKALAKKARGATRIPSDRDPLASLSQEQKEAWLRDLVKKTSEPPIPRPTPSEDPENFWYAIEYIAGALIIACVFLRIISG